MTEPRQNRFASQPVGSGVERGFEDAVRDDPINKGFIRRNLGQFGTLKKFAKKGGLAKLRGKNFAQLERMAVRAVLKKNKVKRRKLKTGGLKKKYGAGLLRKARKKTRQGVDIRDRSLGQRGKDVSSIKNKKVRKATKSLIRVRRNRRIMKTKLLAGKGYDIHKGIR